MDAIQMFVAVRNTTTALDIRSISSGFGQVFEHTKTILHSAIQNATPSTASFRVIPELLDLYDEEPICLAGVGKAALPMAWSVGQICNVVDGIVTVPEGYANAPSAQAYLSDGINVIEGNHPTPGKKSQQSVIEVIEKVQSFRAGSSVVVVISGGGSSLWGAPHPTIPDELYNRVMDTLAKSALPVDTMNVIRSQLGYLSGGGLCDLLHGRRVATFVLSDVPVDDISVVASGPMTHPTGGQTTRFQSMISELGFDWRNIPKRAQGSCSQSELIKIGDNLLALEGARTKAEELGFTVSIRPGFITGEAREVGKSIAEEITASTPGTCVVYGGESVVKVTGRGKGGRNQELALSAAIELDKIDIAATILAAGTDGIDGPTNAAGAVVNELTCRDAERDAGVHLANNNSYNYFLGSDNHIITGPTQTNVMDIAIAVRR
ncbi:MAG: DUF4147 domain-containing protein [Rhodothermales bacterium]|nr:DUF4147 domain-containing protein [Rhodothermales bacterium]